MENKKTYVVPNYISKEADKVFKKYVWQDNLKISGETFFNFTPYDYIEVQGDVVIEDCHLFAPFLRLYSISGDLVIKNSKLTGMFDLRNIDGSLLVQNSIVTHLTELVKVGKDVVLDGSTLAHCPKIELVGGKIHTRKDCIIDSGVLGKELQRGQQK